MADSGFLGHPETGPRLVVLVLGTQAHMADCGRRAQGGPWGVCTCKRAHATPCPRVRAGAVRPPTPEPASSAAWRCALLHVPAAASASRHMQRNASGPREQRHTVHDTLQPGAPGWRPRRAVRCGSTRACHRRTTPAQRPQHAPLAIYPWDCSFHSFGRPPDRLCSFSVSVPVPRQRSGPARQIRPARRPSRRPLEPPCHPACR